MPTRLSLPGALQHKPTRLDGQQEIYFYLLRSRCRLGSRTYSDELSPNIAILVPANLEFTLRNTGDRPLVMYVINEPVPDGFRPNSSILVKDENKISITSSDGHWAHIVKTLFVTDDGLGTLQSVLTVTIDPLTMGMPHVVDHDDVEEVWSALVEPAWLLSAISCESKHPAWRSITSRITKRLTPTSIRTKIRK